MRIVLILPVLALLLAAPVPVVAADKPSPGAEQASPFARGSLRRLDIRQAGTAAPADPFEQRDGKRLSLSAFRGEVVVLNLWATWCAPCLKELPSLDRLQRAMKDKGVRVVTVSMDRGGWRQVDPFWTRARLTAFTPYLDKTSMMAVSLKARGLPMVHVYDRQGREVARLAGGADWASKEALAFISAVAAR